MSNEVVIEGELCSWQTGERSAAVMVKNPTYPSRPCSDDWAPLSGRRVRVTVEAVKEPEPRCPFCGGEVTTALLWCGSKTWLVNCCECDAKAEAPTKEAALDALAEWLDVCPRCGGRAEYGRDGMLTCWYREGALPRWYVACAAPGCRIVSSHMFHTAADAAAWWNKRAARK